MGKSLAISSKGLDFDSFMKEIARKPLSLKRLKQLSDMGSSYDQPPQDGRTTTKSKPKPKIKAREKAAPKGR